MYNAAISTSMVLLHYFQMILEESRKPVQLHAVAPVSLHPKCLHYEVALSIKGVFLPKLMFLPLPACREL